mgnify:FL=1
MGALRCGNWLARRMRVRCGIVNASAGSSGWSQDALYGLVRSRLVVGAIQARKTCTGQYRSSQRHVTEIVTFGGDACPRNWHAGRFRLGSMSGRC